MCALGRTRTDYLTCSAAMPHLTRAAVAKLTKGLPGSAATSDAGRSLMAAQMVCARSGQPAVAGHHRLQQPARRHPGTVARGAKVPVAGAAQLCAAARRSRPAAAAPAQHHAGGAGHRRLAVYHR